MNIVIVHNLPSGGAKRSLFEQVKRLSSKHSCDVYTLSTADHDFCDLRPLANRHVIYGFSPARLFNSPLGRLNQGQRWLDLQRLDTIAKEMAREIDGQRYDVVYVHPCRWTQAPLVIRHLTTPMVYYLQEPPRHLYAEAWRAKSQVWRAWLDKIDLLLALYKTTARRLDLKATQASKCVLVNSKFMKEIVHQIYAINPQVCYLGVDTDMFCPLAGTDRENFVLSVGAIQPSKGFDFIIQSLGRIKPHQRPALRLVGNVTDSHESQRLQSLALEHGVQLQVEVNLNQDKLVERYNQARLFIYAPHNEPFGLTILEAMACGTTAVGVDEGGVKETIVDGVTGRLVKRDPDQMAQAIEWLLNDPYERREYELRAIENIRQNWTWDEAAHRIEMHLQSAAT